MYRLKKNCRSSCRNMVGIREREEGNYYAHNTLVEVDTKGAVLCYYGKKITKNIIERL